MASALFAMEDNGFLQTDFSSVLGNRQDCRQASKEAMITTINPVSETDLLCDGVLMDFTHEFSERPDTFLLTGSDSSGTGVSENLEDLFPEWLGVKGYDVLGAEGAEESDLASTQTPVGLVNSENSGESSALAPPPFLASELHTQGSSGSQIEDTLWANEVPNLPDIVDLASGGSCTAEFDPDMNHDLGMRGAGAGLLALSLPTGALPVDCSGVDGYSGAGIDTCQRTIGSWDMESGTLPGTIAGETIRSTHELHPRLASRFEAVFDSKPDHMMQDFKNRELSIRMRPGDHFCKHADGASETGDDSSGNFFLPSMPAQKSEGDTGSACGEHKWSFFQQGAEIQRAHSFTHSSTPAKTHGRGRKRRAVQSAAVQNSLGRDSALSRRQPQQAAAKAGMSGQACLNCGTTSTPLWRGGPQGPKTLCNACGVRYMKSNKRPRERQV
mmetsp:Transcript_21567/g.51486  ORF Transcript_21567/g.51486 Transcript_21567/m.51486 type:complete len:442 (-) Transcript_21567:388-1713(-)